MAAGVRPYIEASGGRQAPAVFGVKRDFDGAQSQTGNDTMNLIVRTNVIPRSLVDSVSGVIAGIDPDVPTFDAATMEEMIAHESGSQPNPQLAAPDRPRRSNATAFAQ